MNMITWISLSLSFIAVGVSLYQLGYSKGKSNKENIDNK